MAKNLTDITKDLTPIFENHSKKFTRLLEEIQKLKDPKNPEILTFAAFLIEIQEIEFHLMNLITELSLVEPTITQPRIKERKTTCCNKPIHTKGKDIYDMTLGEMKNELDKFDALFLKDLKKFVSELNRLRRIYAHHLFSGLDSWDKIIEDAKKGIQLNSQVLGDIFVINRYINENTDFGKLMNKKIG